MTLIEIMIAICIAAIVMFVVNFTFFRSHETMERVRKQREVYQAVRLTMDRITKDITCAYIPWRFEEEEDKSKPDKKKGVTEEELSDFRFIGKHEKTNDGDFDSLFFTTTTDIGLSTNSGCLCEVDYFLKEMPEDEIEGIKPEGKLYYLLRREDCLPHNDISTKEPIEIAEYITGMKLVYIDKDGVESEEWDLANQENLPAQVRVTLYFNREGETLSFTGVSYIPLSRLKIKKAKVDK